MSDSEFEPDEQVVAALKRVEQLDLQPVHELLRAEDPDFWTEQALAETELAYRRFLALNLLYPAETVAVNGILDEFWHHHILDTQKYADDCEAVFGSFLHHYPHFGRVDEADRERKHAAFAVTQEIWEKAFGTSLLDQFESTRQARLTLDKVIGAFEIDNSASRDDVFAAPKSCKNGQHGRKVIGDVGADVAVVAIME